MWIFRIWTKSLRAQCSPNAGEMVPVPCSDSDGYLALGKDNCSFSMAGLQQVRSARKSGTGGGSTLMVHQLPLGWQSQGYKSLIGKGRSFFGGKQSPGLCCYSRRCQAALLTSFLYQFPVPQIQMQRGQTPSSPHHV